MVTEIQPQGKLYTVENRRVTVEVTAHDCDITRPVTNSLSSVLTAATPTIMAPPLSMDKAPRPATSAKTLIPKQNMCKSDFLTSI